MRRVANQQRTIEGWVEQIFFVAICSVRIASSGVHFKFDQGVFEVLNWSRQLVRHVSAVYKH